MDHIKKATWLLPFVLLCSLSSAICPAQEANSSSTRQRKLVLAHYLPWHSCSPEKNQFGWHWTMNQFDPSKKDSNRLPEIASHYHPLVGPYDGNDPDLIDYHLQLMKLTHIDGVILDWYGVSKLNDYPQIHQMSCQFVKRATEYGFQIAVCYEDRILTDSQLASLPEADQRDAVLKDLTWLQQNWFRQENYVRVAKEPLLLNFGPIALQAADWDFLRRNAQPFPKLFTLPHLTGQAKAEGCFQWVPVSGGKISTKNKWQEYLRRLENDAAARPLIAGAFSGYHDIYGSIEGGKSYGSLAREDGQTLKTTLSLAKRSRSPIVQLITWNDFGEGTMLEPTHELGFTPLRHIQSAFGTSKSDPASLELPLALFRWRKQIRRKLALEAGRESLSSSQDWKLADRVSDHLLKGEVDLAKRVLDTEVPELKQWSVK